MDNQRIVTTISRLSARSQTFHLTVAALGFLSVALLDGLIDPEFSLLTLYLLPIVYALWFLGTACALGFCGAGLVVLSAQDWLQSAHAGGRALVPYWNLTANLALFGLIVWLLAILKGSLEHDRQIERERGQRELDIAREVQLRLLPARAPDIPGVEVGFAYKAARTVGGDYYDFIPLGAGRFAVVIADVSGKGLAAALLMATLQGLIRTNLPSPGDDLSSFASRLSRNLYGLTETNKYATLFFALYDSNSGRLHYVNAGHNAPLLLRGTKRTWIDLDVGGPPVGLLPKCSYETASISLAPGDMLVAFTDGVVEALDPHEQEFGEERLQKVVTDVWRQQPSDICARVLGAVERFASTAPQFDDITLVILRVTDESMVKCEEAEEGLLVAK